MAGPKARRWEKALAMGADEGFLVSDRAFAGADTWATSLTLARAIERTGPFDAVLCGKQAIDGDTAQVGPGIAAWLGWPQVTYVTGVDRQEADALEVTRLFEEGSARMRVRLPAVLTVLKEANEPRLPVLSGRLRALDRPWQRLDATALGLKPDEVGLMGSPTRVVGVAVPDTRRRQRRLDGEVRQVAAALAEALRQRHPGLFRETDGREPPPGPRARDEGIRDSAQRGDS